MTRRNDDISICLLYPPSDLPAFLNCGSIPLGIYVVASVLRRSGMRVSVLDQLRFLEGHRVASSLRSDSLTEDPSFRNAVCGIDVLGISADSFNYSVAKQMIEAARAVNRDVSIILGGIHASLLDEYLIRTSGADVVFRGEAEERVVDVVKRLVEGSSLESIPGITYRSGDGSVVRNADSPLCTSAQLAQLSRVDYELIAGLENLETLPMETSRGCLYRCKFCSVLYKGKRRLFPTDEVRSRIIEACRHNRFILFTDDCFTFERERAAAILSFFDQFEDRFLHFEARATDLAGDGCSLLDVIDSAKIKDLQVGVECGYDDGLRRIRKGITLDQVKRACGFLRRAGVERSSILTFIIGFPWEGAGECLRTLDFAKSVRDEYGVGVGINYWVPSPSELWSETKDSLGMDESMFDQRHWVTSDEVFRKAHPLLSAKDRLKLSFLTGRISGAAGQPIDVDAPVTLGQSVS